MRSVLFLITMGALIGAYVPGQESAPESRYTVLGCPISAPWWVRHQDPDGGWSPQDFPWSCEGQSAEGGRGKAELRVAATGLVHLIQSNAGHGIEDSSRKALGFLLSQHRADGGFVPGDHPHAAMTNACATIAVCRNLALARQQGRGVSKLSRVAPLAVQRLCSDQGADGAWGKDDEEARKVSVAVWNLLALRAGQIAGIPVETGAFERGRAWVESAVAQIERRGDGTTGPLALVRARASRAVARATTRGPPELLSDDVAWLLRELERGGTPVRDAEVLLFSGLAARKSGDSVFQEWAKRAQPHLLGTRIREGCAEDTWTTPSIWWDDGGRLMSTALITWALELYYAYPKADWI